MAEEFAKDSTATFIQDRVGEGFDFSLAQRNATLMKSGMKLPKFTKTGTTIVGCMFKDGIVLGADTRATSDTIVAQKNCEKIHYIAPNIYCCGAGTAADTEQVTGLFVVYKSHFILFLIIFVFFLFFSMHCDENENN